MMMLPIPSRRPFRTGPRHLAFALLALTVLVLPLAAACGGDDDDNGAGGATRTLGGQQFADHGTKDLKGETKVDFEADSFYFQPTFLRGNPGQKLTLHIENESSALHNLSVTAQGIDKDLPANQTLDVEVTFPQSGVLLFVCKYHAGQGMAGELLSGDAEPAPAAVATAPSRSGAATSGSPTASASGEAQATSSYYSY